MAEDAPTFRAFVTSFTDFLTVAVHTILYERAIYPQTAFLSARKYNFAVRQNRHPKVCEWINDAMDAVETEVLKGMVGSIAVVIYSKQNKPLERFMFDISRFPAVPISELDVPLQRLNKDGSMEPILPLVDLEEQFRATISRLSNCGPTLKPAREGSSFTIAIEMKSDGNAPTGHPQPWVPAQGQGKGKGRALLSPNRTIPVRAVAAGDMIFESWIEEVISETSNPTSQANPT